MTDTYIVSLEKFNALSARACLLCALHAMIEEREEYDRGIGMPLQKAKNHEEVESIACALVDTTEWDEDADNDINLDSCMLLVPPDISHTLQIIRDIHRVDETCFIFESHRSVSEAYTMVYYAEMRNLLCLTYPELLSGNITLVVNRLRLYARAGWLRLLPRDEVPEDALNVVALHRRR